ncbi:zinc finger homeobox protein 3 isoform X2 [Paroedura picta]|uniref:zinc finger homeobox protein 3 isoform X2 n=1 Tax=Paroedura picta TaxID=143630 RepID=UPI004056EB99
MECCDSPVVSGKDHVHGLPFHQPQTEGSSQPGPMEPLSGVESHDAALGSRLTPSGEGSTDRAPSAPGTEPASKEVSCHECATSFTTLQTYMEHHCPGASHALLPLPEEEESGSDAGGEEESDVEDLAGEIVYQPDGSAYIVESLSQLVPSSGGICGAGHEAGGSGAIPSLFLNSLPGAGVKPREPQIINTFHIASSFGKWFEGSGQAFPDTSALAGVSPVLHSFRVFDVRHTSNKDYLNSDGSAKSSCVSKDAPNNVDLSTFDGFVLYGKRKPILMCFLCKLSFGYVRSFVSHAVQDHRMTLSEEERKILSNKNISALIQGIGKDKEPLISFLEPKTKNFPHPLVSTANLIAPGQSFYGKFSGIRMEGEEGGQGAGAASRGKPPQPCLLAPGALLNLGGLTSSALKTPITSVPLGPLAPSPPPSSKAEGEKPDLADHDGLSEKAEPPGEEGLEEEGEEEEEEEEEEDEEEDDDDDHEGCKGLFPRELDDELEERPPQEPGAAASSGSGSEKDLALSNQSISPLMPTVPQSLSGGTTSSSISASSFVFDGGNRRNCLSFNSEGSEGGRRLDFSDESANRDCATLLEPNESGEGEDGGCVSHHQHPGPPCELAGGECPSGSGVECPKCDTVLGSSRSLGGHMTMMHSRNSCKTLKCPKCNWHYKYQQTLEAHMKEKHPEPGGSCAYCKSGQPHPRLARGESYTCGYKPFRCEVCNYSTTTKGNLSIHMQSDKHLNNMQNLQNGGGEQVFSHSAGAAAAVAVAAAAAANLGNSCGAPSPTKPKSKPTWRCEVCDYETNVARNLRIHMTSEKHMHNMMLLQQNMSQAQHSRHLGLSSMPAEAELYQYYLAQNMTLPTLKTDSAAPEAPFLMGSFPLDPTGPAASLAPALVGGEIPLDMRLGGGPLVSEELMNLGETFTQTNDPSLKLFQCAVCNKFSTDNLDLLGLHMNIERSLPEEEWKAAMGDSYQCKLCRYNTQLKANFQLHCKTDKHVQKFQLVAHIKEGGKANEWRLKCVAIGNPVHLKCNACDYYTNSLEKLRLHTVNSRHEASLKLYKHLQHHESGVEGESCYYHCILCNYSTKAKLNLLQHVRSMKHQRSESLRKLQRLQKGLPEEEEDLAQIFAIRKCPGPEGGSGPKEDSLRAAIWNVEEPREDTEGPSEMAADPEEPAPDSESPNNKDQGQWTAQATQAEKELGDSPASSQCLPCPKGPEFPGAKWPKMSEESKPEQTYQCPYCKYSNPDVNRLRVHAMTQHSVQPMLRCPLCQDVLSNKIHLQLHLTHLHSVSPDCVEKLILTVTTPEVMMPISMFLPATTPDRDGNANMEEPARQSEPSEDPGRGPLPSDNMEPVPTDQALTREDAGFLCWKKGCSQGFKTAPALQAHFSEVHTKRPQLPVSDRHVYKYRCNQCSLAFKTIEKLQLHSQYHVIRAATMCCLCQRSFRTFQALRKHLETNHLELSEADVQQLYSGLLVNGDLLALGDPSLAEDHPLLGEEEKEEESDLDDKQSPVGSDSGSVQEDSGSEPKRALPFRKGPNFTMEKFLDPSRPYKCTVCKESFTQKNILLVHYNSVSHLHKLKRALQESTAGPPEPTSSPDHKPFKCPTCNVAYSQSSTLEIHMRSVLHQTKARAAKLEAAGGGGVSNIPSGSSTPSPVSTTSMALASASTCAASTAPVPSLLGQAPCESTGIPPPRPALCASTTLSPAETKEANRKKLGDMIASRQQQQQQQQQAHTLVQAQAQAQAQLQLQQELQQQAALLQSQLFSPPALLPHFPMTTETLLQLQQQQQQQLLFPFYIPSAEFQLNPEVSLPVTSGTLTLTGAGPGLMDDLKGHLPQPLPPAHCVLLQHSQLPEKKAKTAGKERDSQPQEQECSRKLEGSLAAQEPPKPKDTPDLGAGGPAEPLLLPPRIASDTRGNATRALLENFGFELVIQYNENKQKGQKKAGRVEGGGGQGEKLECTACSKFFSNVLILKSHQEHVHQRYLPFKQLEHFAKQYREHYDKLYPLRPQTPEPSQPPVPPVPPAPPQQPPPSAGPATAPPVSSPTLAPAQPPLPLTQLPVQMELPLFSPLVMQTMPLQTMPAQLPPQLGPLDPLPTDLAQLYQHQLNPGLLQQQQQQQQQSKRPRTRITDDQLRVLRQYFDINNSPSEEQIQEMADKSGLPQKVIKHWFRNTLFKERQRNKDSPYNFSNPPVTSLEDLKVDSRPPSPEPQKHEYWGGKRSSRTRFTDYQLRVLQDFFDANAYPKDDEFEQLSSLLNLPTRVIVVWFQNARQKARKNYENQGEGRDGERRELTNDRYIRTSSLSYQCKKCSLVFQRIFDLIKHQKKLCYKDEDEEGQEDSQNEDSLDAAEPLTPTSSCCSTPMPSQAYSTSASATNTAASSSAFLPPLATEAEESSSADTSKAEATDEKPKPPEPPRTPQSQPPEKRVQPKQEVLQPPEDHGEQQAGPTNPKASPPALPQPVQPPPPPCVLPQSSPSPSQLSHLPLKALHTTTPQQLSNVPPPPLVPYQCDQCKLAFPSFEHWQEHQQLHFLSAQNQFVHPQFLDRALDMPFMLFDPSNPLLASQLLAGTLPQLPLSAATVAPSPSTPTSTLSTLKRRLEEKAGASPGGDDSGAGGEEPQRDKRLRTTITPEQLEVLYQKYLLDSNPTRKMLDHIAHEVGLKKRVVQVWFQNTRARERKGQFRAVGPAQAHRRCPFCRALFKAKTALEAHVRSRHWHEAKRAGYNLTLSAMLLECDGGLQLKADLFDGTGFSHLPPGASDSQALSPVSKALELSPHALLSPSSIKVEGMEDFESPSLASVSLSFDHTKLDNDDCSSVNTAITDITTGDEGVADNEVAAGLAAEARCLPGPSDGLTKAAMIALSEYEDRLSSGLVSPAPSFYSKDYDNEGTVDYSETSSLADPCSPSPGTSGSASKSADGGDRPGQKRFRTQMTNLQLKVLKSCFSDYRTPTMLECEVLGNDIGLPKRVVQVWFQNARAKEKKSKLSMAKHFGINQASYEGPKTECTLCGIKYSARLSVRDHIFSQQHICKVKDTIGSQLDKEKEYFDPATVRQLMAQQELDRIKKANEVLGLAAQQQGGLFDGPPLQALNLPAAYPALQGIPPVLLPGLSSSSLPGFNPSNTALTPPKPNLMGLPSTSVPSPGLPSSGLPNKQPSASLSSPNAAQANAASVQQQQQQQQPSQPTPRKEKESEKTKEKEKAPKGKGESPLMTPKKDTAERPGQALPTALPALEYSLEPAHLQALQAALNSDPTALLTSQFLPYLVPGFSPYYAPQIPGALQSGYLQPLYGMEGLFPYSPALSQALLGLSSGSLLQHYQQYQQSLQEALQMQQQQQQQRQVQPPLQPPPPKGSQTPVPLGTATPDKDPAKESPQQEEQKNATPREVSPHLPKPREEPAADGHGTGPALWDPFIVPKVQYRLVCRTCQAAFSNQEAASDHLKSLCCLGQPAGSLQEMVLHVPAGEGGSSYQCMACESTVYGDEALRQHLESAPHKHRTIPRAARNAKEHPSLLPHSACLPNPSTASTSQPATHSKDSPSPPPSASSHPSRKSWPPGVSRPSRRKPPPPPLSSSSTVTSSSCSTSGVQPSMPTDDYLEESDSDLSQKSDGPASLAERPEEPSCPKDRALASLEMDTFRL